VPRQRVIDFGAFVLRPIHEVAILGHLRSRKEQRFLKGSFGMRPPLTKRLRCANAIARWAGRVVVADHIEVANNPAALRMRDEIAQQLKQFDAVLKLGGKSISNKLPERSYIQCVRSTGDPNPKTLKGKYGYQLTWLVAKAVAQQPASVGRTAISLPVSDDNLEQRERS
jgi:hypothetical protein